MINPKNLSHIMIDDNGVFSDVSLDLNTFSRDSVAFELVAAEDYLYYGRYKPFPAIYFELTVANTTVGTQAVEYWNGTAWASVAGLIDETKCYLRSGFIYFDQASDWAAIAVDSIEAYWLRFKPALDLSAGTSLKGISIIFSDDRDLEGVYPGVLNYLQASEAGSAIARHQTVRDEIVQAVRGKGFRKIDADGNHSQYEAWDFLNVYEVNQWSTYKVLENIFSSLQSTQDGLYKQKADEYKEKAADFENAYYLTLDKDDDGIADPAELANDITVRGLIRG